MFSIGAYFASYLIFSLLSKTLGASTRPQILTLASILACILVAAAALTVTRTWSKLRFSADVWIVSACSALILICSTISYSTQGITLLLPLLLMKGGPLLWAPIVDALRGTHITVRSSVVLLLAGLSVALVLAQKVSIVSVGVGVALLCAGVYVGAYLPKIHVLARHTQDVPFLISELTATLLLALPAAAVLALVTEHGSFEHRLHAVAGELEPLLRSPRLYLMGIASEGAGLFGGLLFIAPAVSSISVPLNRSTSLLAGITASALLFHGSAHQYVTTHPYELVAALAMLAALVIGSQPAQRQSHLRLQTA